MCHKLPKKWPLSLFNQGNFRWETLKEGGQECGGGMLTETEEKQISAMLFNRCQPAMCGMAFLRK
jgi:hypothetical protein